MKITPSVLAALSLCAASAICCPTTVNADKTVLAYDSTSDANTKVGHAPVLSADGRFIGFTEFDERFVDGRYMQNASAFLFDRRTNGVTLLSRSTTGGRADKVSWVRAISGDGRMVLFTSNATNLELANSAPPNPNDNDYVFLRDTLLQQTQFVPIPSIAGAMPISSGDPSISRDGSLVVFSAQYFSEALQDYSDVVYVWNIATGAVRAISQSQFGFNAVLSADGEWIAFFDGGKNKLQNLRTGESTIINVCSPHCTDDTMFNEDNRYRIDDITADGRLVAVSRSYDATVTSDGQSHSLPAGTFLFDRVTKQVSRLRPTASDTAAMGPQCLDIYEGIRDSCKPPHNVSLSGDGRYVSFAFGAPLVPNGGGYTNIYRLDRETDTIELVSEGNTAIPGNGNSGGSATSPFAQVPMSEDGSVIAFASWATNLVSETESYNLVAELDRLFVRTLDLVPPADSDGDGTFDTDDACHLDPLKTAPGSCGCGAADADANGNNVADCLDPKVEGLVFGGPGIAQETYSTTLNIFMQPVEGVKYQIKMTLPPKKKKQPPRVSYYYSDQPTFALAGLKKKTKGTISYRAYLDGAIVLQSPESPATSFKVNKPKKLKKPKK